MCKITDAHMKNQHSTRPDAKHSFLVISHVPGGGGILLLKLFASYDISRVIKL